MVRTSFMRILSCSPGNPRLHALPPSSKAPNANCFRRRRRLRGQRGGYRETWRQLVELSFCRSVSTRCTRSKTKRQPHHHERRSPLAIADGCTLALAAQSISTVWIDLDSALKLLPRRSVCAKEQQHFRRRPAFDGEPCSGPGRSCGSRRGSSPSGVVPFGVESRR